MAEILTIYPHVKGIQVMNDMGEYMFSQYAGRWIPDTPARRKAILKRLASWSPFSNSSPVEGVTRAIRRFHAPDKRISIYVLGDDFSRGSIQEVIDTVVGKQGRQFRQSKGPHPHRGFSRSVHRQSPVDQCCTLRGIDAKAGRG